MLRTRSLISLAPIFMLACTSKPAEPPAGKLGDTPKADDPEVAKPEVGEAAIPEAVEPKPADPKPQPAGAPTGPFAYTAVTTLTSVANDSGSWWAISTPVGVPDDKRDAILAGDWNGIDKRLDPETPGLDNPFDLAASVTLITTTGQFQRKITGLGIESRMDSDELIAVLGPISGDVEANGEGIAVLGTPAPSADAKLRIAKREAPSAELLAELTTEFDASATTLIAGFESIDGEQGDRPTAAQLRPAAECVSVFRPKLPVGYDAIATVGCGGGAVYEGKLAAVFLVGPGKRQPLTAGSGWSVGYGTTDLGPLVDLDGDGIEEITLEHSGYEYYELAYVGWNGSGYAPLPEIGASPRP
jgi:hypothetical protein